MESGEKEKKRRRKKWLENYRTVGKVKKIQFKSRREREREGTRKKQEKYAVLIKVLWCPKKLERSRTYSCAVQVYIFKDFCVRH